MSYTRYEAKFPKAAWAKAFAERIQEPGWRAHNVEYRPGGIVIFDGPDTFEYFQDMLETVGYFGAPPQGPRAKLNGRPAGRVW
jgi:hypothetical protein